MNLDRTHNIKPIPEYSYDFNMDVRLECDRTAEKWGGRPCYLLGTQSEPAQACEECLRAVALARENVDAEMAHWYKKQASKALYLRWARLKTAFINFFKS